MIRTDDIYPPTLRADFGPRTQPAVFDSGPAPLDYEAAEIGEYSPPEDWAEALRAQHRAAPAQPCRGWCARQGRHACRIECNVVPLSPMPRANTDEGYVSRPVPLALERPSRRMYGEALGNILGFPLAAALIVAACWGVAALMGGA